MSYRIIIVEDEADYAKMIRMRLVAEGYDVTIAGDAYSGTQQIMKHDFDLVILDLNMPAGGGFTLLERIRMVPAKASLPVIILTGTHVNSEIVEQAKKLGVSAIFSKPYEANRFLSAIKKLLTRQK